MKIFLAFLQGNPDHPIPAYSFWEYYIKNGIEEAGHIWVECPSIDWAYGLVPQSEESLSRWKAEAWEKTLEYLKKNHVDMFLSYLYPNQIDEQGIKGIKSLNIPCVNFFCDNVREFREVPKEFKVFDLNWVPEFKALAMYERADISYIHLPMPMWVAPEFRTIRDSDSSEISFIGSKDIQRQLLFEDVLEKNPDLSLSVYGSGWKSSESLNRTYLTQSLSEKLQSQVSFIRKQGINAYLRKLKQRNLTVPYSKTLIRALKNKPSYNDYVAITQGSMITLGVNRYPSFRFPLNKPDTYSRLRDIEAPMLGACYLTEWTEGIDSMYEIDKEISVYRSANEMNEIALYLKADKSKRIELRLHGQRKSLVELSIPRSLEKLFFKLKGRSNSQN